MQVIKVVKVCRYGRIGDGYDDVVYHYVLVGSCHLGHGLYHEVSAGEVVFQVVGLMVPRVIVVRVPVPLQDFVPGRAAVGGHVYPQVLPCGKVVVYVPVNRKGGRGVPCKACAVWQDQLARGGAVAGTGHRV